MKERDKKDKSELPVKHEKCKLIIYPYSPLKLQKGIKESTHKDNRRDNECQERFGRRKAEG